MELPKKKYTLWDSVRIVFRVVPAAGVVHVLRRVFGGIQPTLMLLATAKFIDTALAVVAGEAARSEIWLPIFFVCGLLFLDHFVYAAVDLVMMRTQQKRNRILNLAVIDKISRLDYRYIEDQDSADLVSRVKKKINGDVWSCFDVLLNLVSMALNIGGVLAVLAAQVWWAGLALIGVCIPLFWISYKSGKESYQVSKETEKLNRKSSYLCCVMTERETVEERAMFRYTDAMNALWEKAALAAWRANARIGLRWGVRARLGSVATVVASGIIAAILMKPTIAGAVTVGMFVSLLSACFELNKKLSWHLCNLIDRAVNGGEFFKDLTAFCAMDEAAGGADAPAETLPPFERLEFKNVTFAYPGTERPILNNLSFAIENGRHYAIVGANGAGKTTIAKLVCGLYDNYSGEILLNGRDLRSYSYAERKGLFSSVFQDFARYQLTLGENIRLGDVLGMDGGGDAAGRAERAAALVGLTPAVERLPQGFDTPLGKIKEGGQDLSGGEWQRVAMARTVASRASLYILDEPTAALDPLAESRLYGEFAGISRGKTTVFISHRLGSTRLADCILVLDNGAVAEAGTYDELMAAGGLYAEMFEAQRSWYI